MRIQHVLITRFSYRSIGMSRGGPRRRSYDALAPSHLQHRVRLFEIAALPSVLAQTLQDFVWVIIIDRNLDLQTRSHLAGLVESRPRTYFHEFDQASDLGSSAWLTQYTGPIDPGDYLVTTNLDDDDALPDDFVARLHQAVRRQTETGAPLLVLGAVEITGWDLVITEQMPWGSSAPWQRPDPARTSRLLRIHLRLPPARLPVYHPEPKPHLRSSLSRLLEASPSSRRRTRPPAVPSPRANPRRRPRCLPDRGHLRRHQLRGRPRHHDQPPVKPADHPPDQGEARQRPCPWSRNLPRVHPRLGRARTPSPLLPRNPRPLHPPAVVARPPQAQAIRPPYPRQDQTHPPPPLAPTPLRQRLTRPSPRRPRTSESTA